MATHLPDPPRTWVRVARWLVLVAAVLVGLATVDLLAGGLLRHLDGLVASASWHRNDGQGRSAVIAGWVGRLGQRGYTAPVLLVVGAALARTRATIRPLALATVTLLLLNLTVGAAKLGLGRTKPRQGIDVFFAGGLQYPSGHTANATVTTGMLLWLLWRYGRRWRPSVRVAVAVTLGVPLAVSAASLYLNTHWLSDLVVGILCGWLLLVGLVTLDVRTNATRRADSSPLRPVRVPVLAGSAGMAGDADPAGREDAAA